MLAAILTTVSLLAAAPLALPTPTGQEFGGGRLVLSHLDGELEQRPLADVEITDLAREGGALLHFEGLPALDVGGGEGRARLELVRGQRLIGSIVTAEAEELELEVLPGARVRARIDELASLRFPERIPSTGEIAIEAPETGDRLYVRRGRGIDRVDGLLLEFSEGGVHFEGQLGAKLYGWSEIAALYVETFDEGGAEPSAGGAPIVVDLVGGSRLRGRFERLDREALELRRPGSEALRFPNAGIRSIVLDDGSFRFLSDLPVTDGGPLSPHGDELGMTWPHRVDRAVDGGPLRAGGRTWTRGIGVHAPSRLTWVLDREWGEFRALVAIDDSVLGLGARGSVVFRVLVDGEERHRTSIVHGGAAPRRIPSIDLSGAHELVLEVEDAGDLWVADRANWLLPILIARP